ncbi:MAG TPA: GyrI-like domain-containing protein [Caulobacterales bacterium]|nr:GyrI-like domain-containing protein [Caulobacterales bacterium]
MRTAASELICASRRRVRIPEIASAWKPALDEVWAFLGRNPGLRPPDGHNFFLYHHPTRRDDPMDIDFGVQVSRPFLGEGPISMVATPTGEVASTVHVGPYSGLAQAHKAVHDWCAANNRRVGAASWEIYGDWNEDETELETEVVYLLA